MASGRAHRPADRLATGRGMMLDRAAESCHDTLADANGPGAAAIENHRGADGKRRAGTGGAQEGLTGRAAL